MNKILVLAPHEDRAGRASNLARELALRTGASVMLLRVLQETLTRDVATPGGEADRLRDLLMEAETRRVCEIADRFRESGLDVDVRVVWGVVWSVVVELVEQEGFDLVVKPASGLSHEGRVFFGATALHLFRRCPCPVWVVGDQGTLPARVVAAVDPQDTPNRRMAARRVLDWAHRAGTWSDAEVHVASAWQAAAAELLREELDESDWKAYVDSAREDAVANLESLVESAPSPVDPARVHLVEGSPEDALPRIVEDRGADLVVMGTLGRRDQVGDLLGETAETIIRQIHSSVLTIPPPDDPERERSAGA